MARCLLGLGSNLGDRRATLASACAQLQAIPATHLLARSQWYVTKPIGGVAPQDEFLNGAALLETSLPPQEIAKHLQAIENRLGRERAVRWDSRTIDIDLLLFDRQVIDIPTLVVPHPRMAFRKFVLEPAVEIAGEMLHPPSGWSLRSLLKHLFCAPRLVILSAKNRETSDWVGKQLASRLGAVIQQNSPDDASVGGIPQLPPRIELPQADAAAPPVVVHLSGEQLVPLRREMLRGELSGKPALVILIEPGVQPTCPEQLRGLGSVASITCPEPDTILQEATAAICSVWPDLLETESS